MTKTAKELVEWAIGCAILADESTKAEDIQTLRDQTLRGLEAIIVDAMPHYNTLTRDMVSRGEVKEMLDKYSDNLLTALYGEEKK